MLDTDIERCAQYHVDKHAVKMVLETTQLLNNAVSFNNKNITIPYRVTHKNHPATLWASKTDANFKWLTQLGLSLCKEYTYRYGKIHKCQKIIEYFSSLDLNMPKGELTPFVQCMPDIYKSNNAVEAYRSYYRNEKKSFANWTKRSVPEWWKI